ncbi:MAG: sel1 repeat family protein [Mizugakiibacter sp.]|uniref:sel1 repeat family protein n=1 Tax=Mizugakiibacter sp. TaxID=1972610 RepID=UPI0031C7273B|nr:sel1 repeat family protein [Xanthomonadaceae bacterium]
MKRLLAAAFALALTAAAAGRAGDPALDASMHRLLRAMNEASTWGHPDQFGQFAGVRHFAAHDYAGALQYFRLGAYYADKLSQLSLGLMYLNGQGVDKDPVAAYAWIAVSAERGYPQFLATRDRLWSELTPTQRGQAKDAAYRLCETYGDTVAKPRMVTQLRLALLQMTGSRTGFDSGVLHASAQQNCGGATVEVAGVQVPRAGCGGDFWAPSRWDPKQYFAARDAQWKGIVTVGAIAGPAHAQPPPKPAEAAPRPAAPGPGDAHMIHR